MDLKEYKGLPQNILNINKAIEEIQDLYSNIYLEKLINLNIFERIFFLDKTKKGKLKYIYYLDKTEKDSSKKYKQ